MRTIAPQPDLVDQVHAALIDAIVTGEFAAGERLTQEALAERLGVSRQPVLQALLLLRQQGLIVDVPSGRGVQIAAMDEAFLVHLYELRRSLDAAAAAAAARREDGSNRARGTELIRRGRDAVAGGDLRQMVQADMDFHLFIYEASGNPLLLDAAVRHWHHTQRAMSAYLRQPGGLRSVWTEHQKIFDAVLQRDGRAAERLSRHHADRALRLILAHPLPLAEAPAKPRRRA